MCAHDFDSGSSLAAREMPSKGCKRGALQLTNAGQTCNKRPLKIYLLFKGYQHVPFVCAQLSYRNQPISIKLRHRNRSLFFTSFSLCGPKTPHAGLNGIREFLARPLEISEFQNARGIEWLGNSSILEFSRLLMIDDIKNSGIGEFGNSRNLKFPKKFEFQNSEEI